MHKDRIVRGGARGINLQGAGEALDDLRQHFEIGVVRGEEGDTHFEISDGHLWVDCVLMPTESPVTCRLTTVADNIWSVPAEGTEVAIAFPGGSVENGGIIIGILKAPPSATALDQIVISSTRVLIYNTDSGKAEPLPTMAEFKGHTHPDGMGGTSPTLDPIPGVGVITGTTVLGAE